MKSHGKNFKLKKLFSDIPSHVVITNNELKQKGFTNSNIEKYVMSGWLEPLGHGAYRRQKEEIDWKGYLYGLQQVYDCNVHLGGLSALEILGSGHFIRTIAKQSLYIYSNNVKALPKWFSTNNNVQVKFTYSGFLPNTIGLELFDCGGFSLRMSSRERAILEVIYAIGKYHTFNESNLLMENLTTLRSSLIQNLLENCTSIKTIRIFLFLATRNNHKWVKELNMQNINMGKGKRKLVHNGLYDSQFMITYPKELFEGDTIEF